MSATAPDPGSATARAAARALVEARPLPEAQLPPAVQKLVGGPMKAMAARGIAPVRPSELLVAIYQLTFDSDAAVRSTSEATAANLPDKILTPALSDPLPPPVLHLFASKLSIARSEPIEKILYNQTTGDETFVLLANRLPDRELQIIFENEARLLRYPAILEALYANPQARMSSINRAIELLIRNGIRAEGIPSFDEVAKAITQDPQATSEDADASFSGALAGADQALSSGALEEEAEGAGDGEAQPQAAPATKRKSPVIDFTRLKLYEKIRLVTLGNEYCRQNLLRDPNRMVAMAAVRSPRITDSEIVKAAGNRSVCEDVIRYIANQRDLTKSYAVKLSLVQNPKTPVALSLKFLSLLQAEDLKQLSRSKNVPGALSTAARRLMASRKPD